MTYPAGATTATVRAVLNEAARGQHTPTSTTPVGVDGLAQVGAARQVLLAGLASITGGATAVMAGQTQNRDVTEDSGLGAERYAQVAHFGHGLHRLHDAACGHVNTPPQDVSWSQASLLAGLPQARRHYDPPTCPTAAGQRQQHVLERLVAVGALTHTEADHLLPQSWHLVTGNVTPAPGCAPPG